MFGREDECDHRKYWKEYLFRQFMPNATDNQEQLLTFSFSTLETWLDGPSNVLYAFQ
jgi:hypothetical protein